MQQLCMQSSTNSFAPSVTYLTRSKEIQVAGRTVKSSIITKTCYAFYTVFIPGSSFVWKHFLISSILFSEDTGSHALHSTFQKLSSFACSFVLVCGHLLDQVSVTSQLGFFAFAHALTPEVIEKMRCIIGILNSEERVALYSIYLTESGCCCCILH